MCVHLDGGGDLCVEKVGSKEVSELQSPCIDMVA